MSFVASFGVDIAINAAVLVATLIPPAQNSKVQIGCGDRPLDEEAGALTGGGLPDIVLYNSHGEEMARQVGGQQLDPGSNPLIDMGVDILDPNKATRTPEYLKLIARGEDAVCISYVTTTSSANDKRFWHAGYAKECARQIGANFWYPSPETIPGTDFRPGCVWMSSGTRFLQAISVKMTDFAFPTSDQAKQAKTQFEQTPNTLCQAPGRMTLWQTHNINDCTPYYPFKVERNETTGFDLDYQKIVDGHKLPCAARGTGYKQTLEPGKGPRTKSPEQLQKEKEEQDRKNENGQNTNAPQPGAGSFGGETGSITQEELNEQGLNPDAPAPGAGSFGGACGIVPNGTPGEFAQRVKPCPRAAPLATRRRRHGPLEQDEQCVDRLVVSHYKGHSAREVCGMDNAWGPDFASVEEQLHCNMCTREVLGFCGRDVGAEDCFDVEKRVVRRGTVLEEGVGAETEGSDEVVKSYQKVSEWKA
ncbi:hypothetical protein ACN47E_008810 [Coniothyrium glycines]